MILHTESCNQGCSDGCGGVTSFQPECPDKGQASGSQITHADKTDPIKLECEITNITSGKSATIVWDVIDGNVIGGTEGRITDNEFIGDDNGKKCVYHVTPVP